jgi:hypothetical protein
LCFFIFHWARTAAAISAAIVSAFFAACFHRARVAFAAAIGFVATRFGNMIFSRRLTAFVFHRATVFFRAARCCRFACIAGR